MEVPQSVAERNGSVGEGIFKQGYKQGKLDGAKVAKDPFATEINSLANSVVNAKGKEGYSSPTSEDLAKLVGQIFAIGKPVPDKTTVKRLLFTGMKVYEGMPNPPPKPKPQPQSA